MRQMARQTGKVLTLAKRVGASRHRMIHIGMAEVPLRIDKKPGDLGKIVGGQGLHAEQIHGLGCRRPFQMAGQAQVVYRRPELRGEIACVRVVADDAFLLGIRAVGHRILAGFVAGSAEFRRR